MSAPIVAEVECACGCGLKFKQKPGGHGGAARIYASRRCSNWVRTIRYRAKRNTAKRAALTRKQEAVKARIQKEIAKIAHRLRSSA